jgi:O-antigen ligase
MELIRKLIYFGIALLVIKEFNTEEKFLRLIKWLLIACFLSTFYGLIQFLDTRFFPPGPTGGLDPFIWRGAFSIRIFSTFGNPNFYGDFLSVMNPIILAMFLKTRRFYLLLLWILTAFNSVYTYSKGAWIGFSVGFITFSILVVNFFIHAQKRNIRKIIVGITIFVLLISIGAVIFYSTQRTDSIKFRIYTWLSCWEMINTSPIIGTGIGTFYVTYPAWRRPQIFFIEGRHNTETDHPENEYLEVWYDEGIIGFGIFVWLIILTGIIGFKSLKVFSDESNKTGVTKTKKGYFNINDDRAYYMLGFFSAFIGMLSHNFVCVSLRFVSSGVFLWLLIGLINALAVNNPLKQQESYSSDRVIRFLISCFWVLCFLWWKMDLGLSLICGICIFIISEIVEYNLVDISSISQTRNIIKTETKVANFVYIPTIIIIIISFYLCNIFRGFFIGDLHHNIAIFHSKRGEWAQALENYNIVTKNNPGFIMAHYFMGNVFNDRWILNREYHPELGDKETDKPYIPIEVDKNGRIDPERSISKYNDVWSLAPNYVQSHHQAGLIYLKLGDWARSQNNPEKMREYWMKAIECFEKYHKIDPIFPPNYYRLAWIYIQLGDFIKAEESYLRHIYTMDMFKNGKEEMKWVYEQMGLPMTNVQECEIHKGKYHCASWEDWGKRRKPEYSETYVNLGNLAIMTNNIAKSEYYYNKAIEIYPENTVAIKNLATLYTKIGQKDKAMSMWNKLRLINPQDPDLQRIFSNNQKK